MRQSQSDDHAEDIEDEQKATVQVVTLRLRNVHTTSISYYLEPWGEAYVLHSGGTLTLISEGPNGEYMECVLNEASVTTWNDTGSTVDLFEGEQELGPGIGRRPPVPRYPPGFGRPTLPLPLLREHRIELLLHNDGGHPLALSVPAQSERYTLPSGTKCAIVAEGVNAGPIELELAEGTVNIHGWPASQITILEEGDH
ncbi:MAG: hypothetical protein ACXWQ5_08585 [Ktedonobacterales bacterium]